MAKRTVSQLAKELGVDRKDLAVHLEKIGKLKATPRTGLTEEEAKQVRELHEQSGQPQVRVGEERVHRADVVDEVTGERRHEVVTETRATGTVIRRRKVSAQVAPKEPLGFPMPSGEGLPPLSAEMMSEALPPLAPEVAFEPKPVGEELPPPPPVKEPEPPAAVDPEEPPVEQPGAAAAPEPEVPATSESAPTAEADAPPKSEDSTSPKARGARVLGKIDLSRIDSLRPADRPTAGEDSRRAPGARPEESTPPGRKKKRLKVIKKNPLEFERDYRTGRMPKKKRALPGKEQKKTAITVPKASKRVIRMSEAMQVGDLAKSMGIKAGEVLKKLMDLGIMATINQPVDLETATLVASDFEFKVESTAFDADAAVEEEVAAPDEDEAKDPRPPVVTVMGHVDHGKTSLLDAVRNTSVTEGEAGGITQHIGAYSVMVNDRYVTFVDTPGHEAFTAMRARGARVTDIVILVVAADDGVMPQTAEAIAHAKAAEVPIIVAVNKIDRPDADVDRVKRGLSEHGLVAEDWGGDTTVVPISAKTKEGIPDLLEIVILQADVLDLKANASKLARGIIIEAKLERGRGPVATVLVQEGTLHPGDPFVCGAQYGRVRAMVDESGEKVEVAGPSVPVEILGLQGVPEAGDTFTAVNDEGTAKQVAGHRAEKKRETQLASTTQVSLDDLYQRIKSGETQELRVILKADVQGSVEALQESLTRLSNEEVKLKVIHSSVGGVSESDVLLASASKAIILGFHIRPESKAAATAEREGVEIRFYTVIYEALAEMHAALEGLLAPDYREKGLGKAEVRQPFNIPGVGTIAGSFVTDGKINRGARARLVRDSVQVWEGKVATLRRFKDDVREVSSGYECGISLENYSDVKPGDVIEAFEMEAVARKLATPAERAQQMERSA